MNTILLEKKGRKGILTLNRADKRNALSYEMISELRKSLNTLAADPDVSIIILKANGPAFCSGADLDGLRQMQSNTEEQNLKDSLHLRELFDSIYTSDKIVIAQIQGHALAGGCGLASVCDFSFAAPDAKFGYTEVRIGFIPAIVMVYLIRKIGEGRARKLLIGGELISATDAKDVDLINDVVPLTDLDKHVDAFAEKLITTNSGQAMTTTKHMMADIQSMTLPEALDHAVQMNAKARTTADCIRGIGAFLNKEHIKW